MPPSERYAALRLRLEPESGRAGMRAVRLGYGFGHGGSLLIEHWRKDVAQHGATVRATPGPGSQGSKQGSGHRPGACVNRARIRSRGQ